MHSSCIVVRLDWAVGLPAWLIRRFGSPDLTRKSLFTSQKHQSHSSWDLNEDRWLTLSMNIYQFLDIARRCTNPSVHHNYWQNLARLCYQCHFVVSSLELAGIWWYPQYPIMLTSSSETGWINGFSLSYGWKLENPNFLSVWLTVSGLAVCEPSHTSVYIRYTGLILYQCNAHPVFFSKPLKRIRILIRFVTFLHESSPLGALSVLQVLLVVYGCSI